MNDHLQQAVMTERIARKTLRWNIFKSDQFHIPPVL